MKEKRFCPKCEKMEYKSECSYGPEYWEKYAKKVSLKEDHKEISSGKKIDKEGYMAQNELDRLEKSIKDLRKTIKSPDMQLPAWVQSKITKAVDYLDTASDYMHSDSESVSESKKGLWANIHAKRKRGEKPAKPGEKGYPKTLDIDEGLKKARKNVGADKCWDGYKAKGTKIKNNKEVPNCVKENEINETSFEITHTSNDVRNAKRRKKIAKLAQSGVGGEQKNAARMSISLPSINKEEFSLVNKILNEIITGEFDKTNDYENINSESYEIFNETVRIPSKNGNILSVIVDWKGKTYSLKIFFPKLSTPTRREVLDQVNKIYPGSRLVDYRIVDKNPGEPFLQIEDWQKLNRKDKTDGLSQKAVDAYRRENPGSKLQTAVTEKNPKGKRANRRKSFCSRMSGMKKRLTSTETARDPDSKINKALRRWNCN